MPANEISDLRSVAAIAVFGLRLSSILAASPARRCITRNEKARHDREAVIEFSKNAADNPITLIERSETPGPQPSKEADMPDDPIK
jgi:hypothetical protein